LQRREHAQPVRRGGGRVPLPDHRAGVGADPPVHAQSGRARYLADHPDPAHHVHPAGDPLLHLSQRHLIAGADSRWIPDGYVMDPWRYSTEGISVALRVTPRGGRDDIDGIETLANGRSVVKVRVRAIADGGAANKAVTELLAGALRVPKASVKILSGATSRLKQVAVDGDPKSLGEMLRALTAKASEQK